MIRALQLFKKVRAIPYADLTDAAGPVRADVRQVAHDMASLYVSPALQDGGRGLGRGLGRGRGRGRHPGLGPLGGYGHGQGHPPDDGMQSLSYKMQTSSIWHASRHGCSLRFVTCLGVCVHS